MGRLNYKKWEITTFARCIGWLNCLFLGAGFLDVLSLYLSKPDDVLNSKTFILWTPILIVNIISNVCLVLRVSIPCILGWFAFTAVLAVMTFLREVNFLFAVVNVYLIIVIYLMIRIFKKLNNRKQLETQKKSPVKITAHNNQKYKCVLVDERKPDEDVSPKGDAGTTVTKTEAEIITIELVNTAEKDENTITVIETTAA